MLSNIGKFSSKKEFKEALRAIRKVNIVGDKNKYYKDTFDEESIIDGEIYVIKNVAYRMMYKEKLRSEMHFIKSIYLAEAILSSLVIIESIKKKIKLDNNLTFIYKDIEQISEFLNIENELEYDLIYNHFKFIALHSVIGLINSKLNRLSYDETFMLSEDEESFWNGAYFVLSEVISEQDKILPSERCPYEDTEDHDFDTAFETLKKEAEGEEHSGDVYERCARWCSK